MSWITVQRSDFIFALIFHHTNCATIVMGKLPSVEFHFSKAFNDLLSLIPVKISSISISIGCVEYKNDARQTANDECIDQHVEVPNDKENEHEYVQVVGFHLLIAIIIIRVKYNIAINEPA